MAGSLHKEVRKKIKGQTLTASDRPHSISCNERGSSNAEIFIELS